MPQTGSGPRLDGQGGDLASEAASDLTGARGDEGTSSAIAPGAKEQEASGRRSGKCAFGCPRILEGLASQPPTAALQLSVRVSHQLW